MTLAVNGAEQAHFIRQPFRFLIYSYKVININLDAIFDPNTFIWQEFYMF